MFDAVKNYRSPNARINAEVLPDCKESYQLNPQRERRNVRWFPLFGFIYNNYQTYKTSSIRQADVPQKNGCVQKPMSVDPEDNQCRALGELQRLILIIIYS